MVSLSLSQSPPNNSLMNDKLQNVVFLVEANSFERMKLWEEFSHKHSWVQDNEGYLEIIGTLDNRPVCISFVFVKIDGFLVAFCDASSEVVDYKMINDWFDKNCNPLTKDNRKARCDAMNFHTCLQAIRENKL